MKVLIIDCGHGINTAGKRCLKSIDSNQTREWDLNNRTGVVLQRIAEAVGIKVFRVDDVTGKTDVLLSTRVKTANKIVDEYGVDNCYYISIHHNAGVNGGTGGGICVKYTSTLAERKAQAKRLYDLYVAHTGLVGDRSNPVEYQNLYVCRNTKCDALLVELGFMDSKTDTPIILTQYFTNTCAQALCDFINTQLV